MGGCFPPFSRPGPHPKWRGGSSAPPTTKLLIGNPALKAIAEFINKMLRNLCNRAFTATSLFYNLGHPKLLLNSEYVTR